MRKVLAAIAGMVLLGMPSAFAPFASAHAGHEGWFKWREPEEGADVTGSSVSLRAKVSFAEGVDRWKLEVLPPDGYATLPAWGTVCEGDQEKHSSVEIACTWDTSTYPDGKPSRNHAYRLRVTAWNDPASPSTTEPPAEEPSGDGGEDPAGDPGGSGDEGSGEAVEGEGGEPTSTTTEPTTTSSTAPPAGGEAHQSPPRTVVVANPPSAPQGVKLDFAEKTSEVTLTWDPNPEPDVAGYLVQERFGSGEWSLVAKPAETKWTGQLKKKGTYRFRVAAVRYVGSTERVQEGPYREPQSGMRKVEADPEDAGDDTRAAEEGDSGTDQEERKKDKDREDEEQEPGDTTTSTGGPLTAASAAPSDPAAPPPTAGWVATGPVGGQAPSGISPIAPGSPGSVQTRYADPPKLPGPVAPEQAYDPGFSLALPYPKEVRLDIGPPPEPPPRLLGTVALFDSHEDQRRALVGVLAGALLVFIVSMQAAYLNHRPRAIDLAASTDWDDL